MKLLLTDSGIKNASIRAALVEMLGKPIEECTALFAPTGLHASASNAFQARRVVAGEEDRSPMIQIGWKRAGLFEIAALTAVGRERWEPVLREADVLLVDGGDALFLAHCMRASGLDRLLPELEHLTYVGLSAGSMVMTPSVGAAFENWPPPDGDHTTLGIVPFSMCPHVAFDGGQGNPVEVCEKWASLIGRRAYLTDNETAIKVVDGVEEVISEGTWREVNA